MRESLHELVVGETVLVGDRLLTVVELTETEVTFRIEKLPPAEDHAWASGRNDSADDPWGWSGADSAEQATHEDHDRVRSPLRPR